MKRIIPVLIVVLAVFGIAYSFISPSTSSSPSTVTGTDSSGSGNLAANGASAGGDGALVGDNDDEEDDIEGEVRPATEVFNSAADALAAVKKGSVDYDDVVLEQFTQPGEDCSWCPEFYKSVKDLMVSSETKPDERSYYAELLAISGRVDNIQSLVDMVKNAGKPEDRELYSEALELTIGKDDVVQYLGSQLSTENAELKDSLVAAITNQGSPLAVETLYKATVEGGDPDGYYSQGIGLGEVIPDEESIPKLREIVQKRDPYSHLAVKSLLNSGISGLRTVMDILANSPDPEFDSRMLKDAIDHVNYEEEIEAYLKEIEGSSKSPSVQKFAKDILADFNAQAAEEMGEGDQGEEAVQSVDTGAEQ